MSSGERLPLAEARTLADGVVRLLESACERIEIAGSIRREKADIGDVEIVAIPKWTEIEVPTADLFGQGAPELKRISALEPRCAALALEGVFAARPNKDGKIAVGSKLKWLVYKGFALDLYICDADTWGVTLAIRTGCAEFSHKLVTPRSQGGFCPDYLTFKGTKEGGSWRVRRRDSGEPLATPEENDVFSALGIEPIEPRHRTETANPARLAHAG